MKVKRSLTLLDLVFVAVGGMLGSGWLFAPLLAARHSGPSSIVAWIIGGLFIFILALSYAEVVGILPVSGAIASVPKLSHGTFSAAILGWTAWIGYNTAAPIETIIMLKYLARAFPWLYDGQVMSATGKVVAVGFLFLFTLVNLLGVRLFARINTFITWFKLVIPVVVSVALLFLSFRAANFTGEATGGFAPFGWSGILSAITVGGVIYGYIGFKHALDMAGEAINPQRNIPLCLILSIVIVMAVYILLQVAFIGAIDVNELAKGWENLESNVSLGPLAAIVMVLGITWLTSMIFAGSIIGPFGSSMIAVGSNSRLALALAQHDILPKFFKKISSRFVPVNTLALNFIMGVLIVFLVPFQYAVYLNETSIILSFIAGPVALYGMRTQFPHKRRLFKVPFVWLIAYLGFTVTGFIIYWAGWQTMQYLLLLIGAGILILVVRIFFSKTLNDVDFKNASWIFVYVIGVALVSYLGNYDGGLKVIPFGWDLCAIALISLFSFMLAFFHKLDGDKVAMYTDELRMLENI